MRDPTTQIPDNAEGDAVTVISIILTIDPSTTTLVLECQGIAETDSRTKIPTLTMVYHPSDHKVMIDLHVRFP